MISCSNGSAFFRRVRFVARFSDYSVNPVVIVTLTVSGILVFSTLAAYAIAQMDYPERNYIFAILPMLILYSLVQWHFPEGTAMTGLEA